MSGGAGNNTCIGMNAGTTASAYTITSQSNKAVLFNSTTDEVHISLTDTGLIDTNAATPTLFSTPTSITFGSTSTAVNFGSTATAPTSAAAPTVGNSLCNKTYVDGAARVGVWCINEGASSTKSFYMPMYVSSSNLSTPFGQAATSGAVSPATAQSTTAAAAGSWAAQSLESGDDYWLIAPEWGVVAYPSTGYGGTPLVNFKNTTGAPVFVEPTTANSTVSVEIFYRDVKQ